MADVDALVARIASNRKRYAAAGGLGSPAPAAVAAAAVASVEPSRAQQQDGHDKCSSGDE